jgi:hypothetical protein
MVRTSNVHGRGEDNDEAFLRSARWTTIQSLVVADNFIRMLHFTSNITEAYSLAKDVGRGAVWSGLLISAAWGLSFFGAVAGWKFASVSHSWQRYILTITPWMSVCVTFFYAIGANPPGSWMSNDCRQNLLMASRFIYGLGGSVQGMLLNIAGARVTPKSGMVQLELYKQCARTLGIGGGPILSALCACLLDKQDTRGRSAVPALVLAVIWATYAVAVQWLLANEDLMDEMVTAKDLEDRDYHGASEQDESTPLARQIPPEAAQNPTRDALSILTPSIFDSRRMIIIFGSLYGIERSFIISALESATSFILETEFGWGTKDAGLMVGGTFLLALPMMIVMRHSYRMVRRPASGGLDSSLMKRCTMLCVGGSLLLFAPKWAAPCMILVCNAVVFSSSYLASSVADGLALSYTIPGTAFTVENYMLVDQIAQNTFARVMGPITARYAIEVHGGRLTYAIFQLLVSLLGAAICHLLRSAEHSHYLKQQWTQGKGDAIGSWSDAKDKAEA